MKRNTTVCATAILHFGRAFREWQQNHSGSKEDFISFLSSPSHQRAEFLSQFDAGSGYVLENAFVFFVN